jgi:pimeloyl-ACP methyl ester carboxylesterase
MQQDSQTLTLRDGRTLGYAEWGDLNGKPVFYFTSPDASRYSRHPDETILTELGVHLYTFDRPGRGLSTAHKDRRLLDWADDILEFVQQQNIEHFALIGHSQGSAHCLVCAYKFPEMVSSVTLVTNVAGFDDAEIKVAQSPYFRTQLFLSRYAPWLMTLQWNILRLTLKGRRGEKIIPDAMRDLPEQDQATLNIAGGKEVNFQSMREGLRQGGASVTDDFRIVANDWGFKLEDIQNKAFIWHGEADPMIPAAMSRYMGERIPNNEAIIIPEEGTLLIYSRWREILTQLLGHWKKK